MSEKNASDEFEDEDSGEVAGSDDPDLDHLFKDLERQKRRGGPKAGEPAWRRLEKLREQRHTAELLSDFEDFEIDDGADSDADPDASDGQRAPRRAGAGRSARSRGKR